MAAVLYAGGVRVAVRDGQGGGTTGLRFLLGDHLGSTHVTTDASGVKLAELRYKPWGDVRHTEGSTPTSFRFTGQREEADLGIYYYGARWYDPALGHFLQSDSVIQDPANPLSWNRFSYVGYNPLHRIDPTGRYFYAVYLYDGASTREARQGIDRYLAVYNYQRLRQALVSRTPAQVYGLARVRERPSGEFITFGPLPHRPSVLPGERR